MTDTPRFTDGFGREYVLRRHTDEDDESYRRRVGVQARLRIRYEDPAPVFEQIVFIEADRRILTSKVKDLRRQLSDVETELARATAYLDGQP